MKFVDDCKKEKHWYNRNYFWVVTLLYVAINIVIYAVFKRENIIATAFVDVQLSLPLIKDLLISIGDSYCHVSWEHVLLNMLSIFFCLFYLERKIGSFNLIALLLGVTILDSLTTTSFHVQGNSGIWFACLGYVLIDFVFSFKKEKRNMANIILGTVVLLLEYFRIGFYDKIGGGIGWGILPYQLIYNHWHFVGFIIGVVVGLMIQISAVQRKKC